MFTEITDDNFADSVAEGLNLVLFYKEQCPFCKAMKKIVGKFAERPAVASKGIGYYQINRETCPKTVEAMAVERVPAIVVFLGGKKIHSKSGDITYKDLERMVA
jgi:thioredoxin-like negative regulator of GroEL